ncbi:TetR/AcrR family transcriptional regulator [Pseudomonas sp. RP23018S]|uniref:TetR/AcrR family transcriptional regulator n=1 Tax=Pseudomonas sp. RP23018S TaxID=3096037 RepID=UPI002ACAD9A1|nr:TetR/AcrR family transcriptional regulator [Pseudomonas sp. RP23018S]MDZ5602778.1 TetR/AcrR family transcriptional regulator [Pseudomonas sp. RP23018S]
MESPQRTAGRGRPRTITRERIVEVSLQMGLPHLTFVGVAAALGVTHMALYKHVASLEALKSLVAEEVFQRWQIPQASGSASREGLEAYLSEFARAVCDFVKGHPGLTPYVIRRLAATQPMIDKIVHHQQHVAQVHGLSLEHARWALATVAFQGFAMADTVYSVDAREPLPGVDGAAQLAEMEAELHQGLKTLIVGVLAVLAQGAADGPV